MTLQPRTSWQIVVDAWRAYRARFGLCVGLAAVAEVPTDVISSAGIWLLLPEIKAHRVSFALLSGAGAFLSFLFVNLAVSALTVALDDTGVGFSEALRRGAARYWPLLFATVAVYVLDACGLALLIVPGLCLIVVFAVVGPAVVLDRHGTLTALSYSRSLTRARFRHTAGTLLYAMSFQAAMSAPAQIAHLLSATHLVAGTQLLIPDFVNIVVQVFLLPFSTAVSVLLYRDLQIRAAATV